jgi:exodeoxyribonuclease VII large subunit
MKFEQNRYLTVQALTKYIKRKFDRDPHLSSIYLKGEISNFKQHSSGHMYFTIKDDRARILAVMFSSSNHVLKFKPENGMQVLVRGDVSVYEAGGQYQIYVKEMQPDGIGELYLAYEQLKEKLEKLGYFQSERKRRLPQYPKRIAVVTSPTGAAIRDIITTIKRRYPLAEILIFSALVQGENAAKSIANSIRQANQYDDIDVMIIGRGGGSIEELWAFNEEIVAQAIYSSEVPVISAVGHETDFTIADFVADLRAPTPTAAGELAVPHIEDLLERIMNSKLHLIKSFKAKLNTEKTRLNSIMRSYALKNPRTLYEQKMEHVDRLTERLQRSADYKLERTNYELERVHSRLLRLHPSSIIVQQNDRVKNLKMQIEKQYKNLLREKQQTFSGMVSTLEALSPLKIMDRGYSVAYEQSGELIKSTKQINIGDDMIVHLSDGKIYCQVETVEESGKNDKGK